jgi:hypothetical protein
VTSVTRSDRFRNGLTLSYQNIDLPKLRSDLFSRVPLPRHRILHDQNHTSGRATSKGAAQYAALPVATGMRTDRDGVARSTVKWFDESVLRQPDRAFLEQVL